MRIEPNSDTGAFQSVELRAPIVKREPPISNSAMFSRAEGLNQALQGEPEVREAELERAIALVGQVQWPPMETIRRIANLLARHLPF